MSHYDLKDKNNENILITFKDNSIIHNDGDNKNKKSSGIEYSMTEFVNKINSIASSKNVVDISKSINLENPSLVSYAAIEATKYKSVLRGDKKEFIYKFMINKINCDINPSLNNKLRQSIAITKWKLYNFMKTRQEDQSKKKEYVEFDISVAYWVAILAGIYLYFDEKDEMNLKQSNLLGEVCKPFTVNSFK
jgi:hypothetical protein